MANVLKELDSNHVLVVHSEDKLDEISVAAKTNVCELKNGQISEYQIDPADYDLAHENLSGLQVDGPEQSLALIKAALGKDDTASAN